MRSPNHLQEETVSKRLKFNRTIIAGVGHGMVVMLLGVGIAVAGEGEGGGGCTGSEPPTATTGSASLITETAADLKGTVNPKGCETTYQFEYGTTETYGQLTGGGSAGEGTSNVEETNTASNLTPKTTYHFRIVATSFSGTTHGSDKTFMTPSGLPVTTTEEATSITDVGATLNGTVNPKGAATEYAFEYGTTTSYGTSTAKKSAGSGVAGVKESASVTGLIPETIYHFLIAATNEHGTNRGSDKTFKTSSPSWAIQSTPSPAGAKSSRLSFGSWLNSTACTRVGADVNSEATEVPLAERWNGSSWSAQTPPIPAGALWSELLGVSCTSETSCAAAGRYETSSARQMFSETWTGTEWTIQTTPNPTGATGSEMEAISCTSSTACTAVGHYTTSSISSTLAERWNGTSWTVQTTPNPS